MRVETEKKLFTSDDINKMYEARILDEDDRVELLDGEILFLNPGKNHITCTDRTNAFFTEAFGRRAIVSIQSPVVVDIHNEPKPDVLVFKYREDFYVHEDRTAKDVLLVVEISDTTLTKDRTRKLRRYAASGIPEFWIEDLKHQLLLVYRDPEGDQYKTCITLHRADSISPLAFTDIVFKIADLLG